MYKYALAFILGAGVGVLASMKFFEKRYKDISEKEIQEVKTYYHSKNMAAINEAAKLASKLADTVAEATNHPVDVPTDAIKESVKQSVNDIIEQHDYTSHSKREPEPEKPKVRPISDHEYDTDLRHEKVQLTWYQGDSTLADGDEQIVSVADTVGKIGDLNFGMYGDDIAYHRNDYNNTDYMIYKEYCRYTDVIDDD